MLRVEYPEQTEIYDNTRTLVQRITPERIKISGIRGEGEVQRDKSETITNGPQLVGYKVDGIEIEMPCDITVAIDDINEGGAKLIWRNEKGKYTDIRDVKSIEQYFWSTFSEPVTTL